MSMKIGTRVRVKDAPGSGPFVGKTGEIVALKKSRNTLGNKNSPTIPVADVKFDGSGDTHTLPLSNLEEETPDDDSSDVEEQSPDDPDDSSSA